MRQNHKIITFHKFVDWMPRGYFEKVPRQCYLRTKNDMRLKTSCQLKFENKKFSLKYFFFEWTP